MKKVFYLILVCLIAITIIGCGKVEQSRNGNNSNQKSEKIKVDEPRVNWWKVSKFASENNSLVIEVENPNDLAIDFTFDVSHYLSGAEVGTSKDLHYYALKAHEKGIIMYSENVMDTDDIKINFTKVENTKYLPVNYNVVTNEKTDDNHINVELSIVNDFTNGSICVIAYNGEEIVSVNKYDFKQGTETKNQIEVLSPFDHYETYYNVYR